MKISLTAFTDRGEALAVKITKQLNNGGEQAEFVRCGKRPLPSDIEPECLGEKALRAPEPCAYVRAADWTGKVFGESDALVFIGAAGIAVRSIAPHIVSKTTDPAVVVIDETGRFVVPILSGHLGGANALALRLASITGGQAVITTATDVNSVFAFDDWARRMNCAVENTDLIREVSGTLLRGGIVPVWSDFEIFGEVPCGVEYGSFDKASVCITIRDEVCTVSCEDACADCRTDGLSAPTDKNSMRKLRIIPRVVCVGIGCRRGTPAEEIEDAVMEALMESGISPKALCALASIDLKAEEEGIKELSRKYRVPFLTYSAEELGEAPGEFTGSEFVMSVTGVDNVCERAAVRAASSSALFCGAGNRFVTGSESGIAGESDCGSAIGYAAELICRKRVRGGVTVALARRKADLNWEVRFQ